MLRNRPADSLEAENHTSSFNGLLDKYGYRNFESLDKSKNTGPWGFLLLGELFQNNHHHAKNDANFAKKWFEIDLTYQIMRFFNFIGIIQLNKIN